ncbi:hypothetical protein [Burkholderia pseudomultivorans]|uniref:Uncharacterized protein n=1 Tax=Burkholderia pseudomultivorans TaxID=1207504 RepID=A0A132EG27_9BURK|nr:hypothetical protein [Burkholderia pseudomultivorans]KWF26613.1 hypothetical protein WT56_00360 [Burkholderia pseudomultivorans]
MQTISQFIKAATGYSAGIGGRTLYVQSCDVGSTLTITLTDSLGTRDTVIGVGAGAKLTPAAGFTKVEIGTTADANVQFVITNGDIDVQLTQVGTNVTNTNANPVPVSIVSEPGQPFEVSNGPNPFHVTVDGAVNVTGATLTATNVGLIPAGAAISEAGATAVPSGAATHVLAAAGGRKRAIFYNAGAGRVGLGGAAGLTFANAAIVLQPGDAWRESDAPQLDWYAVSDTGSTVNIQTVN